MSEDIMKGNNSSTSKLALLRQSRSIKKQGVDIGKAIDGFVASIDDQMMMAEIKRNSACVNLIVDRSDSMEGTPAQIADGLNGFATRQAAKIYTTKISLTLFDDEVTPKFVNWDSKQFVPIKPWECVGCTNIYDATISAISSIQKADANHKIHLIITDGRNTGSEHPKEEVQKLITSRESEGEHVFLLYNKYYGGDAKEYAQELGIKESNAVNFNREGDGIKIIFQTLEDLLDALRTTGTVPKDWAKVIRAHAANPLGVKAREIRSLM